jgi:hypothetical protein
MPETPQERLERLRAEMGQRAALFKTLVNEFGPRILDVAKQHLIDTVQAQFENMTLPQRDLDAVMKLLWDGVGDDLDFSVEAQTPKHLKLRVTHCMWADEMRKLNAAEIGYVFSCCWDQGFCAGLNPAIKFTRTKTLMQGDECCDHTYDLDAGNLRETSK